MARERLGDVVVLLPGITGSVLRRGGKDAWALSGAGIVRALFSGGGSLRDLKLEEDPPDVDDLGDGVVADRLVDDVHLIPGLWSIDGYTKVRRFITDTFSADAGKNYFELPYDWRRDNRVAARRLARESTEWLRAWRESSGNADAKLILVAHSMGGLVARYFLECLDGWRDTRLLLTFGTPYRGSLNALGFLSNGFHKGLGPASLDLSALLRSFTSVYQLLPTYRCFDPGTGKLARVDEADIPHVDRAKATAALAFHSQIRDAVERHDPDQAYRDGRYELRPVLGILQPTSQSAKVANGGIELESAYEGDDMRGDGTVPRVSATPIDLHEEAGAMYSNERHGSLQNADPVLVQLRGLLSDPRQKQAKFRAISGLGLRMELQEVVLTGEPIGVSVWPERTPAQPLRMEVEDADTGAPLASVALKQQADGAYRGEVAPLPEGVCRVQVGGGPETEPVTELVAILPPGS